MTSASHIDKRRDFLAVACELDLLTAEAADTLAAESRSSGRTAHEILLHKGLLTPTQLDIVETLRSPGQAVPGYETLGLIGYGGMGVVYRARQVALDRTVALKTVLVSQLADPAAVKRFEQEATLAARLAHPHIVTAYDFGRHEGRLFFAMELVAGEDAERLVQRAGPLDEVLAWSLVRQAASGLAHAKQLGIVHRDIKPANLLLVRPPAGFPLPSGVPLVKIADFGLARLSAEEVDRTRLTSASAALGSPLYMAPEQLQAAEIDHRVDLYALGATAYHLLAGRPPLAGRTMAQIMAAKLTGQIPDLRSVQPEVTADSAALVAALMAVDPAGRPADYDELIGRIDRLPAAGAAPAAAGDWPSPLSGVAVSAAPTIAVQGSTTQEVPRTNRPSRRWMLWTGVAAAAIAAGVPLVLQLGGPGNPGQRDLVPSGRVGALFDGQAIDPWLPLAGGWYPGRNEDRAVVLEGHGVVRRALALPSAKGTPEPVEFYRLTLFAQLHEAQAVEVHFELADASSSARRKIVRITPTGSQLAERTGDRGPISAMGRIVPHVVAADRQHVVQIERHSRGWWVLVDEQFVGAVRARIPQPAAEIRLAAEEQAAWFSDVSVEELVAPGP